MQSETMVVEREFLLPGDLLVLESCNASLWRIPPDDPGDGSETSECVTNDIALVVFVHPRWPWVHALVGDSLGWLYIGWIVDVVRGGKVIVW